MSENVDELGELKEKFRIIQMDMYEEYHSVNTGAPWIVGFSGGKDSTLVVQLV